LAALWFLVLPPLEPDLPAVSGQKIQSVGKGVKNVGSPPPINIVDRQRDGNFPAPTQSGASERAIAKLDRGSNKQCVEHHGFPSCKAVRFETCGRKAQIFVPAYFTSEGAGSRSGIFLNNVNAMER
jgi:hypothetical protein